MTPDFYDKMKKEQKLLDMSLKESQKQKEERTPSEEMQEKLEPIPCPMHEDYDKTSPYLCHNYYKRQYLEVLLTLSDLYA
tara:strand:+ start:2447 stop:2686 length:240 start_codon:yes stop_codon:yes gene_type:complete